MYQYEDPPEVQSPEHRSVVFASLASYISFLFILGPCGSLVEHYARGSAQGWIDAAFPFVVSFVVLYLGCLQAEWPWPLRVAYLLLVSCLILACILAYLGFFIMTMMITFRYTAGI